MPRRLTEKERAQVSALMRKVSRPDGGTWNWPTAASIALERELTGATQQSRDRVEKMLNKADSTEKDQGDPIMPAKTNKNAKVTRTNKKATRKATAPKRTLAVAKNGEFRGIPGLIVDFLVARGRKGATEPEVRAKACPHWNRCTWTMKKTITAANKRGFKGNWKDEDGGTRYFLAKK